MNKLWLVFIAALLLFAACNSSVSKMDADTGDSDSLDRGLSRKPVIALYPLNMDESEPVVQTLGEAFSGELSGLLDSMQTYDVRSVPSEYTLEDLKNRLYDHIIQAEVRMEPEGGLTLQTRVFDARSGDVMVALSETTYDFLRLFPLAEQMVDDMVQEFYGEHIALATLNIQRNHTLEESYPVYLFVDGVYRELDEDGKVEILAGNHEVLLMGHNENWVLARKSLTLQEGESHTIHIDAGSTRQLLFRGQPLDIRIDGDPSDWEYIEKALVDEDSSPVDDPGMDLLWLKLASDEKNIYGLVEFAAPFRAPVARFDLAFYPLSGKPQTGLTIIRNPEAEEPMMPWVYAQDISKGSVGKLSGKKNFLEFSIDWGNFVMYEDEANRLDIHTQYGTEWKSGTHTDRAHREERIQLTDDPTPILAWLNRDWEAGTDGPETQFYVPFNLIAPDGDPSDWIALPLTASENSGSSPESLWFLKSAVDRESFYLYLQARESWDKDRVIRVELDGGDGSSRVLVLEKRKTFLEQDGERLPLKGDLRSGRNFLEARFARTDLGSPEYCNVMIVRQEEGNSLPVVPYY